MTKKNYVKPEVVEREIEQNADGTDTEVVASQTELKRPAPGSAMRVQGDGC